MLVYYLGANIYYKLIFECFYLKDYFFVYSFMSLKFNCSFKIFAAPTVLSAQESLPSSHGHLQNRNTNCDTRGQATKARVLYG